MPLINKFRASYNPARFITSFPIYDMDFRLQVPLAILPESMGNFLYADCAFYHILVYFNRHSVNLDF